MFEALPALFGIGIIAVVGVLMARSFNDKRKSYDGYSTGDGGVSSGGWFPWFDGSSSHDSSSSSSDGGGGGGGGDGGGGGGGGD